MKYFKDMTKNGKLICVWKGKDEEVIQKRADSQSIEITQDEYEKIIKTSYVLDMDW
jgi:hypothetical protein